jgi:hypothetical protein
LKAVKESAMDCNVYSGTNKEENLVCYGYGKVRSNQFGTYPTLELDKGYKQEQDANVKTFKPRNITDEETGIEYALNDKTGEVYDMDNYDVVIGHLVKFDQRDENGKRMTAYRIEFIN